MESQSEGNESKISEFENMFDYFNLLEFNYELKSKDFLNHLTVFEEELQNKFNLSKSKKLSEILGDLFKEKFRLYPKYKKLNVKFDEITQDTIKSVRSMKISYENISKALSDDLKKKTKFIKIPNFIFTEYVNKIKRSYLMMSIGSTTSTSVSTYVRETKEFSLIEGFYKDILDNRIKTFDESLMSFKERTTFYDLLVLSNIMNFKRNESNLKEFKNNLIKYILCLDLCPEDEVLKEEMNKSIEIDKYMQLDIKITSNEIHSKVKYISEELTLEKFQFLILSFSMMLNNLVRFIHINGKFIKDMSPNFSCKSQERIFLSTILSEMKAILEFLPISKSFPNSLQLNALIENLLFADLLKLNSNNLFVSRNKKIKIKGKNLLNPIIQKSNDYFEKLNITIKKGKKNFGFFLKFFMKILFYVKPDKSLYIDYMKLTPHSKTKISTNNVIFFSGFMAEKENHNREWQDFLYFFRDNYDCYFFEWDSCNQFQGTLGLILSFPGYLIRTLKHDLWKLKLDDVGDLFKQSLKKSKIYGEILAFFLASKCIFRHQTFTFIGYSIGGNIAKHCLKTLNKIKQYYPEVDCMIENVIFLGGAFSIDKKEKYKEIFNLVSGKIINCWAKKDFILKHLYPMSTGKEAIGFSPLNIEGCLNIENQEFNDFGHYDYKKNFHKVISRLNLVHNQDDVV